MRTKAWTLLGLLAVIAVAGNWLVAGEPDCGQCGCCGCELCRVCVPKRTEKEVTKVCWDVKCEDVCIPGCSKKVCEVCGEDECGCYKQKIWEPTCARIKTRKVPVKTEVKRKVPMIEWVVEYRCHHCGACYAANGSQIASCCSQPEPAPVAQPQQ
ncbi:MAG: hypothetical protein K1X74_08315 [Pirellulales bacterium]|nr:hypothetical protein [Pirellulales bacterium]